MKLSPTVRKILVLAALTIIIVFASAPGKMIIGKKVIIEPFGGEGNDWSFVRTPPGYRPFGTPFKLIILNHGNGWVMDGSDKMANASAQTQYGVDSSYSSPLIEALLRDGYVVAGAQNYGDNLYGNDQGTEAFYSFYKYVQKKYNVQDSFEVIAFSAGALTTLNAPEELKRKMRRFVGLYPLVSLSDQYSSYAPHKAAIEQVYGSDTNKIKQHCPVRSATVIPRTLIISSSSDTVVNIQYSYKLKGARIIDIDEGKHKGYHHGDPHHFMIDTILNFLH